MFELELSKKMRIHPVFHILLLESVNSDTPVQNKLLRLLSENKYEVEKIKDYDAITDQYLIKWKNYNEDKNTWETRSNLVKEASRILAQYQKKTH